MKLLTGTIIAAFVFVAAHSHAQIIEKKSLNLEGAKTAIAAAVDYAKKNDAPGGVIAVVDEGGNLMIGGIPIIVDGQVVGGIGVSGAASANQDEELALAGAAVFHKSATADPPSKSTSAADVNGPPMMKATSNATFIDAEGVAAAFAKGQPLLETAGYKVHASRRVERGLAEIHTRDTDVIYVVDGSATLVTGGKAVDTKVIAPNEIRGSRIEGGEEHHITKGDAIII